MSGRLPDMPDPAGGARRIGGHRIEQMEEVFVANIPSLPNTLMLSRRYRSA